MSTTRLLRAMGLEHRTIQNPAVPLTSAAVLAYFQGEGGPSEAGPTVTTQGALGHAMVMACTKVLAQAISALPLVWYRRTGPADEDRERAPEHPASRLLRLEPNPEMTPATWKATLQGHLCTWGNAYARTLFDGGGRPTALFPLLPNETQPKRKATTLDLVYVSKWRGRDVTLDPLEVLHVPGLGFDGITGYSPVGLARQGIAMGLAAEQFGARFFRNGAWLGGVFEHPMALSDRAHGNMKNSLAEHHTGAVNAHKPLILEEGMKWHQATMPAEDAMFLALRKFQNREVCALFRVPPHMVADMEGGASYSSVEQLSLDFVTYALGPWIVQWEQELTRKLGGPDGEYFAAYLLDALLRGDTTTRFQAYRNGRDGGFLTVNEIRRRENLPPVEDGDELLRPLNMGVVGQDPEPDPTDPAEPPTEPTPPAPSGNAAPQPTMPPPKAAAGLEAAPFVRELVTAAAGRMFHLEQDRLRRAAKGAGGLAARAAAFYAQHREHLEEGMGQVAAAMAAVLAGTKVPNGQELRELARQATQDAAAAYCAQGLVALEDPRTRAGQGLEDVLTGWTATRPAELSAKLEAAILDRLNRRAA